MNDQMNTEVTSDDKLWALLSWILPILAVVVLFMEDKKNRPFIKYHAVHSIVVAIAFSIIATVTAGCGSILVFVIIFWAIKAYQGEYIVVPVITDFIKKQGWA